MLGLGMHGGGEKPELGLGPVLSMEHGKALMVLMNSPLRSCAVLQRASLWLCPFSPLPTLVLSLPLGRTPSRADI